MNMWSVPPGRERTGLPVHVADACMRVLGIADTGTRALRMRTNLEIEHYAAG